MESLSLSYEGLTAAEVIHALHHGTRVRGMGAFHNNPGFTVDDAQEWVDHAAAAAKDFGPGREHLLRFDYVAGRPLKVALNTESQLVERVWLYDRDAGEGACAAALDHARQAKKAA
jgi:hypothetical protein